MDNYLYIPDCIIHKISEYLDIVYIKRFCLCNKRINNLLIPKYINFIKYRKKYIIDNFHPKIIKLMGGIDKMLDYPILHWRQRYESSTGYIDNIPKTDLSDNVMIGLDYFKRAFICMKVTLYKNTSVITIFQRYTSNKSTWVSSSNSSKFRSDKIINNGMITDKLIEENINKLINRTDYMNHSNYNHNNCDYNIAKINNVHLYKSQ